MSDEKIKVDEPIEEENKEDDKVKKAMEILQEEENKKINAFMEDYKNLCSKHWIELSATPVIKWWVKAIQ